MSLTKTARVLSSVVALSSAVFASGCGGEPPPKEPEPVHMPTPNRAPKPRLQLSQELGEIDPKKADQAFDSVKPKLVGCQQKHLKRLDFLAGDAKFFVRIDATGKVRWIYLEESTIGDRETEKCVLDVLTHAPWPAPEGGEAEVRKGFGFDLVDAREPTTWGPDKAAPALSQVADEVKRCRGGKDMPFKVTAYVEPDGKRGKVTAVGVSVTSKEAEAKADCVAEAVKGMKLPSPGSYAAKLTFSL